MTETEKRVPDLRFKGFIEDWEQRKLGELASFSKGAGYTKGDLKATGKPIILYGRLYTKYETVIENVDTFVDEKEKSVISAGNEIIVPASGETSEDISRASVVAKPGIILGGDLNIVKPNTEIDPSFLALTISNGRQQKELSKKAQGKSVVHLHNSDLKEVTLVYPKKEEQTRIGNFFKNLDNTIALHQRKLTLLEQLKQTYQLGMFPHNGGSIPALRFAGFSEPWEQRKLNDLYEKGGSGGTPQSTNKSYYKGDIPFLGISDISASNGYIYDTEKHISEKGLNNSSAWIVPKEAISLAMYASVGKVAILKTEAATSQAFYNMVFKKISTRNFIFQYLLKIESTNGWNRLISTGTQANLNAQKVRDLEIMIPSLEEQDKIGTFFNRIDHTIDLHQKKISHIQDLKKALLQKMFI